MARNCHHVTRRQWSKWNKHEQGWFNRMWRYVGSELLPTGVRLTRNQMSVLRHNVCFQVAECHKFWGRD